MQPTVTGLYYYPIKGCRGLAAQRAEVGRMGIRYDRQWMIVDEHGVFVAQRSDSGMGIGIKSICLIETAVEGESLVLRAPKIPSLSVPLAGRAGNTVETQVWRSICTGVDQGDDAAKWFTEVLSRERRGKYRLIRMPDDGVRRTKRGDIYLAFADGYPFLIISQASLDDLNARLPEPLPMNRFRPNIVIGGAKPYDEDYMSRVRIGGVEFQGKTLCVRCATTTTNQLTAERGKEPLKTLATYRKRENGVIFGRNFAHVGTGTISVGDEVEVLVWEEERALRG